MAKKRTKRAVNAPKSAAQDFINSAPVGEPETNPYDPNEPRTIKENGKVKAFKTIGVQFNRHEWWELEQAEKRTKRSKNSIIREGIKKELNSSN